MSDEPISGLVVILSFIFWAVVWRYCLGAEWRTILAGLLSIPAACCLLLMFLDGKNSVNLMSVGIVVVWLSMFLLPAKKRAN